MKINKILALSTFAVLLSACAADDGSISAEKDTQSAEPITFQVSESSRATFQNAQSLQKYGFRVYANLKSVTTNSIAPYMEGVKVSFVPAATLGENDRWEYSPMTYWPADKDKVLDFYPVYAYDDPNVSVTFGWDSKPHARYTVNDDVMKQTDFLWAAPLLNITGQTKIDGTDKTYGQDGMTFRFMHPLSGVSLSLAEGDVTYVDGANTYTSMKEALDAIDPAVGATYFKDYIHSFEISGAFPKFADVNPDATDINKVWDYSQSLTTNPKYTLLASDEATEESADFAMYKNTDGDYVQTKKGNLVVLPCGSLPVTFTINHVIECNNGDSYLIKAVANTVLKFDAGRLVNYNIKYNVPKFIRASMTKLDSTPTIGIALGGEMSDGMHAK